MFGTVAGIETALWYAPDGMVPEEDVTFKRSNALPVVAEECHVVRNGVGLIETSTFAKFEVTGSDARAWLDGLLAGRIPKPGRMALNPLLNEVGKLIGDFTVASLSDERFLVFGSGLADEYHMRLFSKHLPEQGVALHSHGLGLVGLSVAGPKSRDVLSRITMTDLSNTAFPFMSFAEMKIGMIPGMVGRVTFTGDLGYEIWCRPEHQVALYKSLMAARADDGIRMFGARALKSLSIEKAFGSWATEYRPIHGVAASGQDRFVAYDKPNFIGRDPSFNEREEGPARKLCLFEVDASDADCIGDEPIWCDGEVIGWITSGAYAHHVQKSLVLGYIYAEKSGGVGDFEIEIIGESRHASLLKEPPFDPSGARMRG